MGVQMANFRQPASGMTRRPLSPVIPTQVGIHAFLWLDITKAWMPTAVGMTGLDYRRCVDVNAAGEPPKP
jgi:hypothetical protein